MDNSAIIINNISKTFKMSKPGGILHRIKNGKNHKDFGKITALDSISFSVKKGENLGIIGLNGSGKTTLLRTIAGVYKPDKGWVKINGQLSPLLQLGVGFQVDLDARTNVIMNGMLLGLSKSDIEKNVQNIIEYAELEKFSNQKLKHFSAGMKARLAFSITMNVNPDILLIDEILSVGDKDFRKKSYETFLSLKDNKKTILHSTHSIEKLLEFSDRVLLLHRGRQMIIGTPAEVINEYKTMKNKAF